MQPFNPARLTIIAFLHASCCTNLLRTAYDASVTFSAGQEWVEMPADVVAKVYHQAQGSMPSELIQDLYIHVTNGLFFALQRHGSNLKFFCANEARIIYHPTEHKIERMEVLVMSSLINQLIANIETSVPWPMQNLNAKIMGALTGYSLETLHAFLFTEPESILELMIPVGCDTNEAKTIMRLPLAMQCFLSYMLWIMAHIALYQDALSLNSTRVDDFKAWLDRRYPHVNRVESYWHRIDVRSELHNLIMALAMPNIDEALDFAFRDVAPLAKLAQQLFGYSGAPVTENLQYTLDAFFDITSISQNVTPINLLVLAPGAMATQVLDEGEMTVSEASEISEISILRLPTRRSLMDEFDSAA